MHPPQDFSNLFLDMNAFFASCEQQVQPKLRGKPVCVAPFTGSSGCCIAKSYEAKAFGVATGTSVGEAKKLCPPLTVIQARPALYIFFHQEILKVLQSFSPHVSVLSIDEFNIKLSGSDQNESAACKMGQKIKEAIREKVGDYLRASVGIGPSYWVAKVAAESQKPDGLTIVKIKNLPALYGKLKLLDLPGINWRMERQLLGRAIRTPLDFFNTSLPDLSCYFHHPGRIWFYKLRGYEIDEACRNVQSVSHEHVLPPEYRNPKMARRVLIKLIEKCGTRLRRKKLCPGAVGLYISFLHASPFFKTNHLDFSSDSQTLLRAALFLFDQIDFKKPPFKIRISFSCLKEFRPQKISLFPREQRKNNLSEAIDKINDRFGNRVVYPASMMEAEDAAPLRIPFGDPERLES